VLNAPVVREGKPYPPRTLAEFLVYPEAVEACTLLHKQGFLLVVVTNQPDIGRGTQSMEVVEAMHKHLQQIIPAIQWIEVCTAPDDKAPDAYRRKPAPGMVLDAAKALDIDVSRSYLIGDRWRDIECGHAAGCVTFFIERQYQEKLRSSPHHYVTNLLEAAQMILSFEPSPEAPLTQPVIFS
jgi:D-glycero-D-manno-heptose 1,7-bisphosphate phosphatase